MKHEHALSLEAFDDQVAWIPHWGTIFDKRSTEALAHFEAAKELVVQMQRMQHNPLHAEVKDVCASERARVSLALWLMRARLNVDVRLTSKKCSRSRTRVGHMRVKLNSGQTMRPV